MTAAGGLTVATAPARARVLWIDAARGVAIIAMVAYHGAFDLAFLGFADWPVTTHFAWRALAAGIASTFLFLAGVSLVVAHGKGVRWPAFLRRLAVIGAAAAAVTAATAVAMPAPIWFGILHAIAAFSVLALPFVFLPAAVTLVVAAGVFALPFLWRDPLFYAPWAYPLGLAPTPPFTFDYEPVFPWLSVTLAGVAVARLVRPRAGGDETGRAWGVVAWLGRNSLVIYLVHQPVLFAILFAARAVALQE
jgi:uncharacterized membrane protein